MGRPQMPATGTTTFCNSVDFQENFPGAKINLVLTKPGRFCARLTTVSLPHLKLFSLRERLPRIACVSTSSEVVSFAFPTCVDSPQIWGGLKMGIGDLMFYSVGERLHQRTSGTSQWSIVSVDPKFFAGSSMALTGSEITPPPIGEALRPLPSNAIKLRRLHAKACRLAETSPQTVTNREVARSIEQGIIHTLVNCLTAEAAHSKSAKQRHFAGIMTRLEDLLAVNGGRKVLIPKLSEAIGVSERTLRNCCFEVLGISPSQYLRLRRLNLVHVALRHSDPATAKICDIAESYGFTELGRFAVFYRKIFGETPSATLQHARYRASNLPEMHSR